MSWRKWSPGQRAVLVLVHLREGERLAAVRAGFGAGAATAWRCATETVRLRAARQSGGGQGSLWSPRAPAALSGDRYFTTGR